MAKKRKTTATTRATPQTAGRLWQPRGFGALDPEKRRALAGAGGRTAQAMGTAHRFTVEEARSAGRKGGAAVAADREHMAEIGRRGGKNRGGPR